MDLHEYKEYLIFSIKSKSEWRWRKAEQYPNDQRNEASARVLSELAKKLAELPADDPALRRCWWAWFRPENANTPSDLFCDLSSVEDYFLSHYGFHSPEDGDPVSFLAALAKELEAERELQTA
jgi:hypothetical protein